MDAVIGALSRSVGVPTPITDLPREAMPDGVADELLARGQRLCPVTDDELPLLKQSIGSSVAASGVAATEIKHVILATETMTINGSWAGHERARGRLHATLSVLGLDSATVTVLTFGGCSTVMTALEYATLLVERGSANGVVVAAVGRVRDGDSRVLLPAVSAIGDGVASCVVTGAGTGWRLNWLMRRAFLARATHRPAEDFGPTLVTLGRALRSVRAEAAKRGLPRQPYLVCGNYGLPTVRLLGGALAIPAEHIFTYNIPRFGHLGTPDLLINLATLPATVTQVLALATGPADFALAALERTRVDPL